MLAPFSGPWLVGTTKVYPGPGADIVMESIALKFRFVTIQFKSTRSDDEVAVGTTIADRPPHSSARALLSACGSYRG
jgi:hypothetical protein